jgi:hypothetical protein
MSAIDKLKDFLQTRAQAYRHTFEGVHGSRVLVDLAKFCKAEETTVHKDERMTLILQGRREVWLRIRKHVNMSDEELWQIYHGGKE